MNLPPQRIILLLALLALATMAGHGHAQERVEAEILQGESLIDLDAVDTYVQEGSEPRNPHEDGAIVMGGDESDVYLLAPSPIGGEGVHPHVIERYEHGTLDNATLVLQYENGCLGPTDGTFTVRTIQTKNWDPTTIAWNDTDLDEDDPGPIHIQGPILGQATAGTNTGNCTRIEIPLDTDRLEPMLEGQNGGLSVFWNAGHQITLYTTNDNVRTPSLHIELETNAAHITDTTIGERTPTFASPRDTIPIQATLNQSHIVSQGGLEAHFYNETGHHTMQATLEADGANAWITRPTVPATPGLYNITLRVKDDLGWAHNHTHDGWDLIVDNTPPTLNQTRLHGQDDGTITVDQFDTIPLKATIEESACQSQTDPCAHWEATWGPPHDPLARWTGNATPNEDGEGIIDETLQIPRPGNATLTLSIQDPLQHENVTTWNLQAHDTQPPTAEPLPTTWLAPNLTTTVKEDQAVPLHVEAIDDLPVQATLILEGRTTEERPLPTLTDDNELREDIQPPPAGEYALTLHLDDGTHTTQIDWGTLTVTEAQGPTIHLSPIDRRISPTTLITIHLIDDILDLETTHVETIVDGGTHPFPSRTEQTSNGAKIFLTVTGLEHDEEVLVNVQARDEAGHETSTSATFTMDREPPRLLHPQDRAWFKPGSSILIDAEDPGGGATTLTTITPNATLEGLTPPRNVQPEKLLAGATGMHEVTFHLKDDRGNTANVTRWIGIDGAPPGLNVTLDSGGLQIQAHAMGSNVTSLTVATGVNTGTLTRASTIEQEPGHFRVLGLDGLRRGDLVHAAITAKDAAGNRADFGTLDAPATFEYPGEPPGLDLERTTDPIGDQGGVRWEAWDPEGTPLGVNVTLRIVAPDGKVTTHEGLRPSGQHTFEPEQEGRYVVEAIAQAGKRATNDTVTFQLAPGDQGTSFATLPERIGQGEPLEVTLHPSTEPEHAYIWATDSSGLQTEASTVSWDEDGLVAVFENLPDETYEVNAALVYGPGLVEETQMGTVAVGPSQADTLRGIGDVLLLALAIVGVVASAYVWYRVKSEEKIR